MCVCVLDMLFKPLKPTTDKLSRHIFFYFYFIQMFFVVGESLINV